MANVIEIRIDDRSRPSPPGTAGSGGGKSPPPPPPPPPPSPDWNDWPEIPPPGAGPEKPPDSTFYDDPIIQELKKEMAKPRRWNAEGIPLGEQWVTEVPNEVDLELGKAFPTRAEDHPDFVGPKHVWRPEEKEGIEKEIDDIFGRFSKGLLLSSEAMSELERTVGGGQGRDWFRAKYGLGADAKSVFGERMESVGAMRPESARKADAKPEESWMTQIGKFVPGDVGKLFSQLGKMGVGGGLGNIGAILGGAGGGGAAGIGGGALAGAAGGPVGVAMLAMDLASRKIGEAGDKVRGEVDGMARQGQMLAGNDGFGMAKSAVSGFADGLESVTGALGPVTGLMGQVVAEEIKAAFAMVDAYHTVTNALIARGKELSGYDRDLAYANAVADVRRTLGDIREADRLGDEIGRLTDAQSRTEAAFQQAVLPVKELLAEGLAQGAEVVAKVSEFGAKLEPAITASLAVSKFLMQVEGSRLSFMVESQIKFIEIMMELSPAFGEFLRESNGENDKQINKLMDDVFSLANPMPQPFRGGGMNAQRIPNGPLLPN